MTKVITNPEIAIEDIIPTKKTIQVFFTDPDFPGAEEDQFAIIPRDLFEDWLERSEHIGYESSFESDGEEVSRYRANYTIDEFWQLETVYMIPAVKDYLLTEYPKLAA